MSILDKLEQRARHAEELNEVKVSYFPAMELERDYYLDNPPAKQIEPRHLILLVFWFLFLVLMVVGIVGVVQAISHVNVPLV